MAMTAGFSPPSHMCACWSVPVLNAGVALLHPLPPPPHMETQCLQLQGTWTAHAGEWDTSKAVSDQGVQKPGILNHTLSPSSLWHRIVQKSFPIVPALFVKMPLVQARVLSVVSSSWATGTFLWELCRVNPGSFLPGCNLHLLILYMSSVPYHHCALSPL